MNKELIEKIKTRGYLRINFQPRTYTAKISSLGSCKDLIGENSVSLRGWSYPYFPIRNDNTSSLEFSDKYCAGWVNWENHKETWLMYTSGQYLHYFGLKEDWLDEDKWNSGLVKKIPPRTSLVVIDFIYHITEIYEFLFRLVSKEIYDEGVDISISLKNAEGRNLFFFEEESVLLNYEENNYRTMATSIDFIDTYSKEQLMTSSQDLATKTILHFFDRFGYKLSTEIVRRAQNNLLSMSITNSNKNSG